MQLPTSHRTEKFFCFLFGYHAAAQNEKLRNRRTADPGILNQ